MNKLIGVAIGLTIAATGLVTVYKETKAIKTARRKSASKAAFTDKLVRSSEMALEAEIDRLAELCPAPVTQPAEPENKLKKELIMAGSWLGLKYNFNDEAQFEKAISQAELLGYTDNAIAPFVITSLRAKERNPEWSDDQCVEAGKIAVIAMNSLGEDYSEHAVFLVVDDIVGFEILNPDNQNEVTGIIATFASKKAAHRRWAA